MLEETEIATRTASTVLSFLSINLKVNQIIVSWYTDSAFFKDSKNILFTQHIIIINQWEIIKFSNRIFSILLKVCEYRMIECYYVNI